MTLMSRHICHYLIKVVSSNKYKSVPKTAKLKERSNENAGNDLKMVIFGDF